jgi:hypothetical protein
MTGSLWLALLPARPELNNVLNNALNNVEAQNRVF